MGRYSLERRARSLETRTIVTFIIYLISDGLAFYVALVGAFFIRKYIWPHIFHITRNFSFTFNSFSIVWMFAIYIFFIALHGLYSQNSSFWEGLRRLWKAIIYASIMSFAFVALGKLYTTSRLFLLTCGVLSFITFPLFRHITIQFIKRIDSLCDKAIIVGAGRAGQAVVKGLKEDGWYNYKIIGFFDDNKKGYVSVNGDKFPILGKLDEIEKKVKDNPQITTAILAIPSLNSNFLKEYYKRLKTIFPSIITVPELLGVSLLTAKLDYLFYEELFLLHTKNRLINPFNKIIKFCFDWIVSLLLLPFLLPVMFIIAIAIKLESKGPIIYTQTRIGKNGKPFKIYKFRSMVENADEILDEILKKDEEARRYYKKYRKLKDDPRITRVGKFIRKTSLDELPQIFNVLKGEMSLVGPRAAFKEELKNYYQQDAEFYFMVRPGITGLWQVSGRNKTDFNYRVQLDSWYVHNWCLWLDFVILLRTVKVVLSREGAY